LLVLPEANELVERATRNITNLHVLTAKYLSTHQVLSANWIIITRSALEVLSDWLASKPKPALKNENPSTAKSKKEEQS
jgi:ribosomal protein L4